MVGENTLKHVASGQSKRRDKDIKNNSCQVSRADENLRTEQGEDNYFRNVGAFNWCKLQEANSIVIVNCFNSFRPTAAHKCSF